MSVVALPSGNLFVADDYRIWEMTTNGVIVRRVAPNQSFRATQGRAYDAATNRIFVSQLGSANANFQIVSLDVTNDVVLNEITYDSPAAITLSSTDTLVIGGFQPAKTFDEDLNQIGVLQSTVPQLFVAEMPTELETTGSCGVGPWQVCDIPPPGPSPWRH